MTDMTERDSESVTQCASELQERSETDRNVVGEKRDGGRRRETEKQTVLCRVCVSLSVSLSVLCTVCVVCPLRI